jgi:hypothetical protein
LVDGIAAKGNYRQGNLNSGACGMRRGGLWGYGKVEKGRPSSYTPRAEEGRSSEKGSPHETSLRVDRWRFDEFVERQPKETQRPHAHGSGMGTARAGRLGRIGVRPENGFLLVGAEVWGTSEASSSKGKKEEHRKFLLNQSLRK